MADNDAPTPEAIAAAQEVLAKAKMSTANDAQKALIQLVGSKAFVDCYTAMIGAQVLNPGNTELNYAISMMTRLSETHAAR